MKNYESSDSNSQTIVEYDLHFHVYYTPSIIKTMLYKLTLDLELMLNMSLCTFLTSALVTQQYQYCIQNSMVLRI